MKEQILEAVKKETKVSQEQIEAQKKMQQQVKAIEMAKQEAGTMVLATMSEIEKRILILSNDIEKIMYNNKINESKIDKFIYLNTEMMELQALKEYFSNILKDNVDRAMKEIKEN